MRIGLIGGSFDPPHKGHLFISQLAWKMLGLKQIWWLVTPQNPFKQHNPAPLNIRMQQCQNLTKNIPYIKIKDFEKNLPTTQTYNTLRFLRQRYRTTDFLWLMGSDNLPHFHLWHNATEIIQHHPICVFSRKPAINISTTPIQTTQHSIYQNPFTTHIVAKYSCRLNPQTPTKQRLNIFHTPKLNISSTIIRQQRLVSVD